MPNALHATPVAQLTTAFATVYTAPADPGWFTVAMLHVVNTTALAATVDVCLVPDGDTPSAANALLWSFEIPANGFVEFLKGDIWPAGSTLQARASLAGSMSLKISGIETT